MATLVVCLLAGLATVVYAIVSYPALPARIPDLRNALGAGTGLKDKSVVGALYGPAISIVLSSMFAVLAWLTARAKRSLREGTGDHSAAAQEAFRSANAIGLSALALLYCALLSLYSVQRIRVGLSEIRTLGTGIWWILGILIVFMAVYLFVVMSRYGQGAALIERGSAEGALTGSLADNTRWVLGMFYVDRDDPAMMVEKRFGFGYTLNYGNRNAVLMVATFVALIVSLAALGILS